MRQELLLALAIATLCAACAAPARWPVRPEPAFVRSDNAACAAFPQGGGPVEPKRKLDPRPYGWALVRYDVEAGQVVKVEILDSSPKQVVDAVTIAHFQQLRFPSRGSAQGCTMSHQWG